MAADFLFGPTPITTRFTCGILIPFRVRLLAFESARRFHFKKVQRLGPPLPAENACGLGSGAKLQFFFSGLVNFVPRTPLSSCSPIAWEALRKTTASIPVENTRTPA